MHDILCRQMAVDFCCTEEAVRGRENCFTEHQFLEGRRRFHEGQECYLKIAVIGGKLLFCGRKDILEWCRANYAKDGSEWFLEAKNVRRLNDRVHGDGYRISFLHPFYIAEKATEVTYEGYNICWYEREDIEQFRGDNRFDEAYSFQESAPDVLGISAVRGGEILGMAGASADSPDMWQIGINVMQGHEGLGIGSTLVSLLKNELLARGKLPYYGTGFAHLASQRLALSAGFHPAWVEMSTEKMGG